MINKEIRHIEISSQKIYWWMKKKNLYLLISELHILKKNKFPIDNETKKGERLANIEFSAPEQRKVISMKLHKQQIYIQWLRLCIGMFLEM